MYLITIFFISLISFTYRACRDSHQWETRTPNTLAGMGANAPTGTPGIHTGHREPWHFLSNKYIFVGQRLQKPVNKGRNHESIFKEQPPLGTKTQGCETPLFKGRLKEPYMQTGKHCAYTPPSSHSCRGDNSLCLKDVPKNSLCLLAKQKERKHG